MASWFFVIDSFIISNLQVSKLEVPLAPPMLLWEYSCLGNSTVLDLTNCCFVFLPCSWVQEFLNEENKGLDVLVEYLSFAQCAVT